ncbi:16S rRNA (cytosine(967)-C(5))-methyltransferase RsmB [Alkaliphilus hydrothermalis]|uniref:16S rRNA (cytosine(967)-C(5))-methyltransferase n=1 Tax=Alkaliphilus hydrothermalis TaxID=1482730 RepID=A0ABS2NSB3_9FIRM|nr:16S rRNA (cytosine(967)-C(5))-methyltransferase RsmB [Alkaliphilus hydrothermalis]MBM7615848.1 16S rRNA (cytosine967-C5)-methyltransferase [Alkaliphilus hydrothermalis]
MNAREGALRVLYDVEVNKAYSNLALNKELDGKEYSQLDKGFMTELVYGVLENAIYIDHVIQQFSSIKLKKINANTLNLLRLGIYQIQFLDKIPPSAAVNESVNLAKIYSKKSSGFVNAILRNVIRNKDNIKMPDVKKEPVKYLSITYSHPEWMVQQFLKHFSMEFTEELLKANNTTPELNVRVNTLKISIEDCIKALEKEGLKVTQNPHIAEALTIKGVHNLVEMELLRKGYIYIQDFGSMLIARIVEPKEGDFVIDVCSAPGGKATHMAQLMKNEGKVLARDIHPHKLKLIKRNAKRLETSIVETQNFNGKDIDGNLLGMADKVLVDAPCSGLGIIRRKPEIKYNKTPDDINEITEIQLEILRNASKYVKPKGFIVYSTCTIEPSENQGVVEKFLKDNTNFQLVNIGEEYKDIIPGETQGEMIQLYPNVHGTDGFFIAKLQRKK